MRKGLLYSMITVLLGFMCACSPRQTEVKVMTFNIRLDIPSDSLNGWKYRKDHVARMIAYYEPDIIGLQEVLHNQLVDLKQLLPQYTSLGAGREDGKEKGESCSLLFRTARFEQLREGTYGLSETPDQIGAKGWDAAYPRVVTWVILKDKETGKEFACFNTHFDHIGQVARRESAGMLLSKKEELAGNLPVIVTGDFNATPDSEIIKRITEADGLKDARSISPVVYGPSWSFHDFGRTPVEERPLIDYIFVSDGVEVSRFRIIKDTPDFGFLSDHNPVMATLTIK